MFIPSNIELVDFDVIVVPDEIRGGSNGVFYRRWHSLWTIMTIQKG